MSNFTESIRNSGKEFAAQAKTAFDSAAFSVAGSPQVFDSRVNLTTEQFLYNQTPFKDDQLRNPRTDLKYIIIHETATRDTTARGLCRRHVDGSIPQRASWGDIIGINGDEGDVVIKFVGLDHCAWHAGVSVIPRGRFEGESNGEVRRRSHGIELLGPNNGEARTERQKDLLARRIRQIELDTGMLVDRENSLFEHAEIAPNRKSDSRGCSADEIMRRIIDLRGTPSPVPVPERPPVGVYYVNVMVALLRAGKTREAKILARLVKGTKVLVNRWEEGQEVDKGQKLWGETHPDPKINEWIYKNVLTAVKPKSAATVAAQAAQRQVGRLENFAAKVGIPVLSNQIEYVDCGGFA